MAQRLISIGETANYLGISPTAVRMHIHRKTIPSHCIIKIGRKTCIDKPALDEFLESQRLSKRKRRLWRLSRAPD